MLSRLLGIIYLLLNRGTVTAGELAEQFEVSVRTIYRDVEQLSMAGIPVYARKGKNGGISLTERFVLDKMVISEEEQRRILAALASLRETGASQEEDILHKLGTFFKADVPDWVAIDFSDWSGRRQELFEQIREAILERKVMEFDYYGQYGEMARRTVEPVQLLFKEYTWYVRAYCRKRQALRLFKVLRMKRVKLLEETYEADARTWAGETEKQGEAVAGVASGAERQPGEKPGEAVTEAALDVERQPGEKPEEAVMETAWEAEGQPGQTSEETGSQEQYDTTWGDSWEKLREEKVVFWVAAREAYRIYDRFEEEEITVLPGGDFLITLQCCLDDWVYGVILSFGPSAKVIGPEYVRAKILEKIRDMEKNYLSFQKDLPVDE